MRKLIGTIVILLFLYVGFFGVERYNIPPFILNWFKSDAPVETVEKIEKIVEQVDDTLKDVSKEIQKN